MLITFSPRLRRKDCDTLKKANAYLEAIVSVVLLVYFFPRMWIDDRLRKKQDEQARKDGLACGLRGGKGKFAK